MIIIPDIHGRTFWKDAVKDHENEEIVFLGDYVDPYSNYEGIDKDEGLKSLMEVIELKKKHPENVKLLLGNHDLSYITQYIYKWRHDFQNHDLINNLIIDNLDLFDIAYEKKIEDMRFLFTHAGVLKKWVENNEPLLSSFKQGYKADELNKLFHAGVLYKALGDVSEYRGGKCDVGSCVWADVNEHLDVELFEDSFLDWDIFQIFGHSQQLREPVITTQFACLDCRRAFYLDDDGLLTFL